MTLSLYLYAIQYHLYNFIPFTLLFMFHVQHVGKAYAHPYPTLIPTFANQMSWLEKAEQS